MPLVALLCFESLQVNEGHDNNLDYIIHKISRVIFDVLEEAACEFS
jgi:hypothetical protein